MIRQFINFARNFLALLDEHTLEVLRKSTPSMIVKMGGMIISLLVSLFLGRIIGADGLGIINLSNRIINIFLVLGLLGMRQVIIKEIAIAHDKKDYPHIGNVIYTAYWLNGGITLVLSVAFIFLSPWVSENVFNEPRLSYPLMIFLIGMTPQVFSRILSSALVGFQKIWQSNLVEQALSIAITSILLFVVWLLKQEITLKKVALFYLIGRVVVTLYAAGYWNSLYKFKSERKFIPKTLMVTALPIFWHSLTAIIIKNADTIIVGWLSTTTEVGLYSVAARLALLSSFFLQITNASVSPKIAALYENGKIKELKLMVQRVTRGLGILGLFQMIIFIMFGKYILNFWGSEFTDAYWILIILGLGQFINIGTGAVGLLLLMCGYEKIQGKISIIGMFFNLILNVLLVKYFGAIGAAFTTAVTIVGINIARVLFVKKKLGIMTLPLKINDKYS